MNFLSRLRENFRRFIRHVILLSRTCTRHRIHGTDISSREYWRACRWEERHGTIGRGKPRRLAVIRQANHPRPRYLNGHRYAMTSQLPYCLYATSLITPIGSYCLVWRRISDPLSMGPSQWARCACQLPATVRYIAKTRSLCARIGNLVARATWVALHRVVTRHRTCPISWILADIALDVFSIVEWLYSSWY